MQTITFQTVINTVWLVLCGFLTFFPVGYTQTFPQIDDSPLQEALEDPDWFKTSFLDFHDDLQEALENKKKGLILYFGQSRCPYCKLLLEHNWGKQDIKAYTLAHFDVVGLNVRGSRLITDFDGRVMMEKEFSIKSKANFTPTLIFYDASGKVALRLVGYYAPYQFRAALEYVADGHHLKESFREFLQRGESLFVESEDQLNSRPFFTSEPYILDRSRFAAQKPLLVVFEQRECHACDVLHSGPLENPETLKLLREFDVVQLDMWAETPVITPDGRQTKANAWANQLGLFYTPTLIFYDYGGKEIIRVDSVVFFYRLRNVIDYVLSQGYSKFGDYQSWRESSGQNTQSDLSK